MIHTGLQNPLLCYKTSIEKKILIVFYKSTLDKRPLRIGARTKVVNITTASTDLKLTSFSTSTAQNPTSDTACPIRNRKHSYAADESAKRFAAPSDICHTFAAWIVSGMMHKIAILTHELLPNLDEDSEDESSSDSSPPAIARRSKFDDEEDDSDVCK